MGDEQFCKNKDMGENPQLQLTNRPWLSQQIENFHSIEFFNEFISPPRFFLSLIDIPMSNEPCSLRNLIDSLMNSPSFQN